MGGLAAVFSSAERKARETAAVLGLPPRVRQALGENDRSATGYLPRAEFEATADRFFAEPEASIRGWERAVDAQARIVAAVAAALAEAPPGDVAIVAHGGVGALLRCHLAGVAITRAEDQPAGGGGHLFGFDRATGRLLGPWRRIEDRGMSRYESSPHCVAAVMRRLHARRISSPQGPFGPHRRTSR